MNLAKLIVFMKEIEKFKTCCRTCRTSDLKRYENDAEHSWHLALFLILLQDDLGDVDFEKILKTALVHDLPEIYAGDTNPYRSDLSSKERDEAEAAAKLFSLLPLEPGAQMSRLFKEYLEQSTPEARIVKAVDKLMPLIQNLCTNEDYSSYRKLKVELEEVEEYMAPFFPSKGVLKDMYQQLLSEAAAKGVFYRGDKTGRGKSESIKEKESRKAVKP